MSVSCGMMLPSTQSYIDNFFAKIDVDTNSSCWIWTGAKNSGGYGVYGNPPQYAHRVSYVLKYGKLPQDLFVCHTCDNPSCVNPEHLFLGTHSDNMKDRNKKGRSNLPRGEKHFKSKLSSRDIISMKCKYFDDGISQKELSIIYGVSISTINGIVSNREWAWLKN